MKENNINFYYIFDLATQELCNYDPKVTYNLLFYLIF